MATADAKKSTKRTRLNPEDRKQIILDTSARIVSEEGVSVLTMDRIGKEVGVSKSLIYAYFPNVTQLLKELYARELKALRMLQVAAADEATTFEGMVRRVTHVYMEYIDTRGMLLYRLQSEPSITDGITGPTYYSRATAVNYVAEIIHETFDIPMDIAVAATDISYGLPEAGGNYLHRKKADRQQIEDLTATMLIGSIKELAANYQTRLRPLKRGKSE